MAENYIVNLLVFAVDLVFCQDDENTSAFVVHWAKIDPRPERFEAYAEKHPDQFSEEQRARLREIISQHQMDKPVDDEDTTLSLE